MRHHGVRRRAVTGAVGLLAVAATVWASDARAQTATAGSEPQSGGTLTYTQHVESRGLDPIAGIYTSATGDAPMFYAVYDVLVMEDPATAAVVPKLAESLTTEDGLVWTLTLRPDVEFSDGTPLDAEAVKFNTERHANPDNNSRSLSAAQSIASMEVIDPLTLEYTLVEPNAVFDRIVARYLGYIASPTAVQNDPEGFSESPVGAGPFLLDEWVRGSHMQFVRNPGYWDQPRPYVDELVIATNADGFQRFNTLQTGQSDIIASSTEAEIAKMAADAGLESFALPTIVGGGQLLLNTTQPPFDDLRVRQAVHLAIDKQALADTVYVGADQPVEHIIREPSPFFAADQTLPATNDAEAQRLIDEYVAENGPVEFTYTIGGSSLLAAEFIQAELLALDNVNVTIDQVESADFPGRINSGNFQMAVWAITALDPEPDLFNALHSESSRNYVGYSDPEMDEALEAGRTSLDPQVRAAAYETVQRLLIRDMPIIWLTTASLSFPYQHHVHGLSTNGTSPLFEQVWLEQ